MTVYSQEYIQGIKDGRATLRLESGERDIAEIAKAELSFCERVSKCMGSAEHADYIKGLRDFWTNQLAKAS